MKRIVMLLLCVILLMPSLSLAVEAKGMSGGSRSSSSSSSKPSSSPSKPSTTKPSSSKSNSTPKVNLDKKKPTETKKATETSKPKSTTTTQKETKATTESPTTPVKKPTTSYKRYNSSTYKPPTPPVRKAPSTPVPYYNNGNFSTMLMTAAGTYLVLQAFEDDGDPIYVNAETGEEVDDDDLASLGVNPVDEIPPPVEDDESGLWVLVLFLILISGALILWLILTALNRSHKKFNNKKYHR